MIEFAYAVNNQPDSSVDVVEEVDYNVTSQQLTLYYNNYKLGTVDYITPVIKFITYVRFTSITIKYLLLVSL